ncbi:MAG: ATP-binding cassette domain-containing protein [Clostridiaceae bacterium]
MSILEFKNVYYSNDNKDILKKISFKVEKNDFISIVGPSGSGKSTILKLCSSLISPKNGDINFQDKKVEDYNPIDLRKNIAYVFQNSYLFGDSVKDNLIFPYGTRKIKVDYKKIEEYLNKFDLDIDYLDKDIKNLSGGEKQRINIIRSLLFKPEILLLDEITSSLDEENTRLTENIIKNLNEEGVTVLWVTHNEAQKKRYANKILTIKEGQVVSLEVIK